MAEADKGCRVRLHRGWLELPRPHTAGEGARRIAQWYEACGTRWLTARLPSYASRGELPVPPVAAADLGSRWGALGQDGGITVHWAVMQLPLSLVDLVLVHELCPFRRELRRVLPDADVREDLFAKAEPELWRGAVR